jgi:hypothetical protein
MSQCVSLTVRTSFTISRTRGDGFPLACLLAMVLTEVKELVPILAAHVYTFCPIAIPTLPKLS